MNTDIKYTGSTTDILTNKIIKSQNAQTEQSKLPKLYYTILVCTLHHQQNDSTDNFDIIYIYGNKGYAKYRQNQTNTTSINNGKSANNLAITV